MTRLMTLQERYYRYKIFRWEFKLGEEKSDISLLLALLLLKDKDKFKSTGFRVGEFYNANKDRIELAIGQVMRDFSITIEDLKKEKIYIKMGGNHTDEEIKYDQFKSGITFVMTTLNCSLDCSPEEMYNKYCEAFGWSLLPNIDGDYSEIQYRQFYLEAMYKHLKATFKKTHRHSNPNVLLAVILLINKEKFSLLDLDTPQNFYYRFCDKIDVCIDCVLDDFSMEESDLIDFVPGEQLYANLGESVCVDNVDAVENNNPIEYDSKNIRFLVFRPAIEFMMESLKNKDNFDYLSLFQLSQKELRRIAEAKGRVLRKPKPGAKKVYIQHN